MTTTVPKSINAPILLFLALLIGAQTLYAQGDSQAQLQDKPKPAGTSLSPFPIVNPGEQGSESNNGLTSDTTPLTGVQEPTLGAPPVLHSYWEPGIQLSSSIQSNSYNQTPNSGWLVNNYVAGTLSLLKEWSGAQLAINYSGGGYLSTDSTQGNGYFHELALAQTFQWRRLSVELLDQFSYLPQSSFGFGGGTPLSLPGTGGSLGPVIPGLSNNYVPNQNIFTAIGPRYSNASSVQLTYATTPRGSVTLSGSYGLLDFTQSGNINNDMTTGTMGYNYSLTPKDTIGAFYRFSAFHFEGQPNAYGDHSANFAYSRKLTGRLALQLYGGPDFTTSRVSSNGNTLTYGVNSGASLKYGFEKGGLSANYSHGISGGGGVLTGSSGDFLSFGASRKLGRIWSGQINVAYAHNSPIQSLPHSISQSYSTWNAGGGVNRAMGRNAALAIAYNATIADYGVSGCAGTVCGSGQTLHYVTINVQWHTRPFVLP